MLKYWNKNGLNRKEASLGIILFSIAFLARALLADSARFTFDEANFFEIIHLTYLGEIFPLLGSPVTAGEAKMPGALFFYIMSISQFFSATPEAANIFTAFCKSLGILFIWKALRYRFNDKASFLTALFMACAPWSILYSDRIWNSNFIGFFVAIAFWSSISLRYKFRDWKLWVVMISCGVMPQVHLSAPIIWLPIMIIIWPTRKNWNLKNISLGFLGTFLFYSPYLYSEIQTNFENLKLIFSESITKKRSLSPFAKVPANLVNFLTLNTTYHELGGYWGGFSEREVIQTLVHGSSARPQNIFRASCLISSLFLLIWIFVFYSKELYYRLKNRMSLSFFGYALIFGCLGNILFLIWTGKKVFPHYVQPLLPFTLFLMAYLIERLESSPFKMRLFSLFLLFFCLGGIESSWFISKRLDARNGIQTQRQVIGSILNDIPESATSVFIDFGFYANPISYKTLSKYSFKRAINFQDKASPYQYKLMERLQKPHDSKNKIMEYGPVSLYRK